MNDPRAWARSEMWALALVAVLGLGVNLGLAWTFDAAGLLAHDDVLFNADTETYRLEFVWGGGDFDRGWGGRTYKHPNLTNFVNPPVRAVAAVLWKAGLWTDYGDARRAVALWVAPVASMLTSLVLFAALKSLGWKPAIAAMVCLLDVVSCARGVYGSVPESFALSGLATALVVLLAARQLRGERPPAFLGWVVVGVFAIGVTIITLVPLVILHLLTRRAARRPARGGATATVRLAGTAVAGTLLITVPMSAIYGIATSDAEPPRAEASLGGPGLDIRRGVEADLGHYHGLQPSHLALFPLAVVSSIVPPDPAVTRVGPLTADARISYLSRADALWPMGLAAALGLAGLLTLAWRARAARPVVLGCAATLGAYGILHLFYGDELFLYALHWQVPLLVLVGAAAAGARTTRAGVAALAVLIGVAGARSAIVIALVLRQWAEVQGG